MCPESTDTLFDGRLTVCQDEAGYRFTVDAVLLASHVKPQAGDTIVDLGSGCGVIPLILSYRHPDIRVIGVEVQNELAEIASRNVVENQMADRVTILNQDMRSLTKEQLDCPVNVVISNPPYWQVGASRLNPNSQRAVARHELKATLADVMDTAVRILVPSGKLIIIYPVDRMTDLITRMRSAAIEPGFFRTIHPLPDSAAKLILVEGVKGGRQGIRIASPLYITGPDGDYTDEMAEMFRA
ncbi:tRNA1(Val) (adenine(37)-N6)-methyltransferase [Thermodesulfobacteriota bacterium]